MILFLIGVLSGIIGGMGIGGGSILIPALVLFTQPPQHVAQSTNLIVFIPTAFIALAVHIRNKKIVVKTAIPIIISGLLAALIGSLLAVFISGSILRKLFGIFLFIMGLRELTAKKASN